LGHRVHPLPPRPERPALLLRPPPQRPVERMAVTVRQARAGEAGEPGGVPGEPERDLGEPPGLDLDVDVLVHGAVDPGAFEHVRGHAGSPVSSARTSARADTPARQSSIDAVSRGEWDTPVGLRTKSIAVGMPTADRMPAS